MNHLKDSQKISKSLRYSIGDGIFYFLMIGCGESFFVPYILYLKASDLEVGVLGSLPLLLGALVQVVSVPVSGLFSTRKKFVIAGAFLQGCLMPVMLLTLYAGSYKSVLFITIVCLYQICGMIVNPSWSSWMGDLVPEEGRGKYFGKRNKITGLFTLLTLVISGFFLTQWKENADWQYLGFVILFSFAFVFRMISVWFLTLKWEPGHLQQIPQNDTSIRIAKNPVPFKVIVTDPAYKNFRTIVFFLSTTSFGIFMGSPYLVPYVFNTLKFDYFSFTLIIAAFLATKYLCMPFWGNISDKYGNRKILILTGFGIPLIPLSWLFSESVTYFIFAQMFSGFVWSGLEIATFNITMDNAPPNARVAAVSFLNSLNGVAIFLGALAGSQVIAFGDQYINGAYGLSGYLLVFFISGLVRYIPLIYYFKQLKEARQVQAFSLFK